MKNIAAWTHPCENYLCLDKTDYSCMAGLAAKKTDIIASKVKCILRI